MDQVSVSVDVDTSKESLSAVPFPRFIRSYKDYVVLFYPLADVETRRWWRSKGSAKRIVDRRRPSGSRSAQTLPL